MTDSTNPPLPSYYHDHNQTHCPLDYIPTQPEQVRLPAEHLLGITPGVKLLHAIPAIDAELIHQFCTRTYLTFALRTDSQLIWRDKVFAHSLDHPFLLRGLLAVAATHKAVEIGGDAATPYWKTAMDYQTVALEAFIDELNRPCKENSAALSSFSMILTILTLARGSSPKPTNADSGDEAPNILDQFVDVMKLLQGIHIVVKETWQWLIESDISALSQRGAMGISPVDLHKIPLDASQSFEALQNKLTAQFGDVDIPEDMASDQLEARRHSSTNSEAEVFYIEIQILRGLFLQSVKHPEFQAEMALGWATMIPASYNQFLVQKKPMALAILAHSVASPQSLDTLWWIHGWPRKLVAEISSRLDESWQDALEWPRRTVGLI